MSYICPFCFEKIRSMSDVHYLCTNVDHNDSEEDPEYSKYLGRNVKRNHIVRNVKDPKDPRCDAEKCKAELKRRLCPYCHNIIPTGMEDNDHSYIAVLGPRGVGKTHYITVLIDTLDKMTMEFGWSLAATSTEVVNRFKEKRKTLFVDKDTLDVTRRNDQERYVPLTYTLKRDKKIINLFFVDSAGEDLMTDSGVYGVDKYIANASGIIYLVDPLQIEKVKQRIGTTIADEADFRQILAMISEVYHTSNKLKNTKKIKIPLAIVLTKCDVLIRDPTNGAEEEVLLGSDSSINIARQKGVFDEENSKQIDAELKDYLGRVTDGVFTTAVDNYFSDYRYFAVSALGSNPEGRSLTQGVSPIRVEDPMLWMLTKTSDIIKVKKR